MSHRAHGTRAKYVVERCRCEPCRASVREYERERKKRQVPPYVGADRARSHVRWLATRGVGLKTVAARSGVSHGALWKLVYGKRMADGTQRPSKRIRRETEDAILSVQPVDAADGAKVDATPVAGIVATLVGRGWTKAAIGRRVHGPRAKALQLDGEWVTAGNLRALKALLVEPVPARVSRWGVHEVEQADDDDQADTEPGARDPYDLLTFPEGLDLSWRARATCRRPEYPTHMFFPARGDTKMLAAAKAVCARCPVHVECGEYALAIGAKDGIWAGRSAERRRREGVAA